jgi:hypothetical protein
VPNHPLSLSWWVVWLHPKSFSLGGYACKDGQTTFFFYLKDNVSF